MSRWRVALVSRDPHLRMAAASAFDHAPAEWSIDLYETRPAECDALVLAPDVWDGQPGAILFDPQRPASALAEVARRVAPRRTGAIVVTGAGRGCGVTSVALHICQALAANGSACFVDLDTRWGAATRLGLDACKVKTWRELDGSTKSIAACALPVAAGFRTLLRSPQPGGPEPLAVVERAAAAFETVVADAPDVEALFDGALRWLAAVLVLPPARPAALRARTLLEEHPEVPWVVVTNRLGPGGETTRSQLQRAAGRRISLQLPCSPALRDAEGDGGLLTSPWSPWRRRVHRLAGALVGT